MSTPAGADSPGLSVSDLVGRVQRTVEQRTRLFAAVVAVFVVNGLVSGSTLAGGAAGARIGAVLVALLGWLVMLAVRVYLVLTVYAGDGAADFSLPRLRAIAGRFPDALTTALLFLLRLLPLMLLVTILASILSFAVIAIGGGGPRTIPFASFTTTALVTVVLYWAIARIGLGVAFSIATRTRNWEALDMSVARYRLQRGAFFAARAPEFVGFLVSMLVGLAPLLSGGFASGRIAAPIVPPWLVTLIAAPLAAVGGFATAVLARETTPDSEVLPSIRDGGGGSSGAGHAPGPDDDAADEPRGNGEDGRRDDALPDDDADPDA